MKKDREKQGLRGPVKKVQAELAQFKGRDGQLVEEALLASLGLYGVLSYLVNQRVREIGLRMAHGASSGHVARMFLAQGMRLTCAGIVVGVIVSLLAGRVMRAMLYEVTAYRHRDLPGCRSLAGRGRIDGLLTSLRAEPPLWTRSGLSERNDYCAIPQL